MDSDNEYESFVTANDNSSIDPDSSITDANLYNVIHGANSSKSDAVSNEPYSDKSIEPTEVDACNLIAENSTVSDVSIQVLNKTYSLLCDAPSMLNNLPFIDDAIKEILVSPTTPLIQVHQRPSILKHGAWESDIATTTYIQDNESCTNSILAGSGVMALESKRCDAGEISNATPKQLDLKTSDFTSTFKSLECSVIGETVSVEFHGVDGKGFNASAFPIGEIRCGTTHETITGFNDPMDYKVIEFNGTRRETSSTKFTEEFGAQTLDTMETLKFYRENPELIDDDPSTFDIFEAFSEKRRSNPPKRVLTAEEDAARNKWPR